MVCLLNALLVLTYLSMYLYELHEFSKICKYLHTACAYSVHTYSMYVRVNGVNCLYTVK